MSNGNEDLTLYGKQIGNKVLTSGLYVGPDNNIKDHSVVRNNNDGWHNSYHTYTVIWTPGSNNIILHYLFICLNLIILINV